MECDFTILPTSERRRRQTTRDARFTTFETSHFCRDAHKRVILMTLSYIIFKNGSFIYFRLFNAVDSRQTFNINFANDWIFNHRPLVLEVTSLPTEPQPMPK